MPFEDLIFRAVKERARKEGRLEALEASIREAREEGFKEAREEGFKEGREEGFKEGFEEGRRLSLGNLLRLRFGPLPHDAEQRIARAGPDEITVWVDRFWQAATLEDVIGYR